MDQRNQADIQHYCKNFDFKATPFNGDMREFWIYLSWILTLIPSYLLEREETKKRHNPVSDHLDMKIQFGDVLSQDESKSKTQHFKAKDDLDAIAKSNILIIYSSVTPTVHAQCPTLWKSHGTDDFSDKTLRKIIHILKRENGGTEEEQNELHLRIKGNIFHFANKPPTTDAQVDKIFNQLIHLENELHHVGNFKHVQHRYELTPYETRTFCTTLLGHSNYNFLRQQMHTVPKPNTILEITKMWKTDAKNIRGYQNHSSSTQTSAAIFSAKQSSTDTSTEETTSSSSTEDTDHLHNPIVQAYRIQNPELSNPQQRNSAFLLAKIKFMEAQQQIHQHQLQIHQQHIQSLESQLDQRQPQSQPFQQQQPLQQRQRQLPPTFPSTIPFQQQFRQQQPFQQSFQRPFQQQQQRQHQQSPQHQQQQPRQQQQQPWTSPGKRTFAVSMDDASEMTYERKLDRRAHLHQDEWNEEDFDDC